MKRTKNIFLSFCLMNWFVIFFVLFAWWKGSKIPIVLGTSRFFHRYLLRRLVKLLQKFIFFVLFLDKKVQKPRLHTLLQQSTHCHAFVIFFVLFAWSKRNQKIKTLYAFAKIYSGFQLTPWTRRYIFVCSNNMASPTCRSKKLRLSSLCLRFLYTFFRLLWNPLWFLRKIVWGRFLWGLTQWWNGWVEVVYAAQKS